MLSCQLHRLQSESLEYPSQHSHINYTLYKTLGQYSRSITSPTNPQSTSKIVKQSNIGPPSSCRIHCPQSESLGYQVNSHTSTILPTKPSVNTLVALPVQQTPSQRLKQSNNPILTNRPELHVDPQSTPSPRTNQLTTTWRPQQRPRSSLNTYTTKPYQKLKNCLEDGLEELDNAIEIKTQKSPKPTNKK